MNLFRNFRQRGARVALAAVGLLLAFPGVSGAIEVDPAPSGPAAGVDVSRISGIDRYETAAAISQQYGEVGASVAFVATGLDFPDALAASAAAAKLGGPLLLTRPTALPAATEQELRRLSPQRIYIVGGEGAINGAVEAALRRIAPTARLAGADRYATGRSVVREAFAGSDHALIATGRDFPDALSASAAAGKRGAPVILVDGKQSSIPQQTIDLMKALGITTVGIAGEVDVVTKGIEDQLRALGMTVNRYGGVDRYATSAAIISAYFGTDPVPAEVIATGADYPDGLSGGAFASYLNGPLLLSRGDCLPPVVGDASGSAATWYVLGGPDVLSAGVAQGGRCVFPAKSSDLTDWDTTGWDFQSDAAAPYSDRAPVNVYDPSIKLDASGLRIYLRLDNNQRADHPVAYAQYGISALLEYQKTGDEMWKTRAIRHAQALVDMHVDRDGAWWFPYRFPWTYYQRSLQPPWWSDMAQGEALSLFTRLWQATGDPSWKDAADRTWKSFGQAYAPGQPWASLVIDRHLYLEEYAGNQPPLLVLNGHIFAAFGLYDYWVATGDDEVRRYLDGAITTVAERMMPLVRLPGGTSYYCVQAGYCGVPGWQNAGYHPIHIWQLDTLARITGDSRFSDWAALLGGDRPGLRRLSARSLGDDSWLPVEPGIPGAPVPDDYPDIAPTSGGDLSSFGSDIPVPSVEAPTPDAGDSSVSGDGEVTPSPTPDEAPVTLPPEDPGTNSGGSTADSGRS